MFTITTLEFIIANLITSICVSAIIGTFIYCITKKIYDAKLETIINEFKYDIGHIMERHNRHEDHYFEHLNKYH